MCISLLQMNPGGIFKAFKGSCAKSWNICSLLIGMKFGYVLKLHLSNKMANFHWEQTNSYATNAYSTWLGIPCLRVRLNYPFDHLLSLRLVYMKEIFQTSLDSLC